MAALVISMVTEQENVFDTMIGIYKYCIYSLLITKLYKTMSFQKKTLWTIHYTVYQGPLRPSSVQYCRLITVVHIIWLIPHRDTDF